jgi:FMN phosphatase YigB (HAD superfamily)
LEKLGSEPEVSVFIDDKREYINDAKEIGLNTILFENINRLKSALAEFGIE